MQYGIGQSRLFVNKESQLVFLLVCWRDYPLWLGNGEVFYGGPCQRGKNSRVDCVLLMLDAAFCCIVNPSLLFFYSVKPVFSYLT